MFAYKVSSSVLTGTPGMICTAATMHVLKDAVHAIVNCLAGNVSMTCVLDTQGQQTLPVALYVAPSVVGFLLLFVVVPLAFLYWRRLAGDLATYKQTWNKRR